MGNVNDMAAAVTIVVNVATLTGLVYVLTRKWIGRIARDSQETRRQLQTSNGLTVGQYVEGSAGAVSEVLHRMELIDVKLAGMDDRLVSVDQGVRLNRALNDRLNERMDKHVEGHARPGA